MESIFGVLKLSFKYSVIPLTSTTDDVYYGIMVMILMHNMMVEARFQKGEVEDGSVHSIIDTTINPDLNRHVTNCHVDDAVSQSDNY